MLHRHCEISDRVHRCEQLGSGGELCLNDELGEGMEEWKRKISAIRSSFCLENNCIGLPTC